MITRPSPGYAVYQSDVMILLFHDMVTDRLFITARHRCQHERCNIEEPSRHRGTSHGPTCNIMWHTLKLWVIQSPGFRGSSITRQIYRRIGAELMSAGDCQVGGHGRLNKWQPGIHKYFLRILISHHNVNQGIGTTQGAQITCTCTGIPDWLTPYGADTLWPRWVTVKDKFITTVGVVA